MDKEREQRRRYPWYPSKVNLLLATRSAIHVSHCIARSLLATTYSTHTYFSARIRSRICEDMLCTVLLSSALKYLFWLLISFIRLRTVVNPQRNRASRGNGSSRSTSSPISPTPSHGPSPRWLLSPHTPLRICDLPNSWREKSTCDAWHTYIPSGKGHCSYLIAHPQAVKVWLLGTGIDDEGRS